MDSPQIMSTPLRSIAERCWSAEAGLVSKDNVSPLHAESASLEEVAPGVVRARVPACVRVCAL